MVTELKILTPEEKDKLFRLMIKLRDDVHEEFNGGDSVQWQVQSAIRFAAISLSSGLASEEDLEEALLVLCTTTREAFARLKEEGLV